MSCLLTFYIFSKSGFVNQSTLLCSYKYKTALFLSHVFHTGLQLSLQTCHICCLLTYWRVNSVSAALVCFMYYQNFHLNNFSQQKHLSNNISNIKKIMC